MVWSMSALRGTVLGGVDEALPYDAVFRIEVSLSSQTTSVIVMRTTARLYCLQGAHSNRRSAGDAEWRSLAYGAPCIQLVRHGNREDDHPFTIKIVIAEVESGISLWEAVVGSSSHYGAMQNNFHTFTSAGNTYAIQFVSEVEAGRMLESMQDLLAQHRQLVAAAMIPIDPPTQPVVFKKPAKPPRRLNKKDISAPCNFKHVSGITMKRTSTCEQELRGTIQRKMRSLSLSNLSHHKATEDTSEPEEKSLGRRLSKKAKSFRRKKDSVTMTAVKRAEPHRMSLPSHTQHLERHSTASSASLSHTPPSHQNTLTKTLSHSSGDIPNMASHPSHTQLHPPLSGHAIERRHTMLERSPGHRPVNYCQVAQPTSTTGLTRPSVSDVSLNYIPYQPVPIPVHEPGGVASSQQSSVEVQRVAIATSDIVGWTSDGRLIVQMQAPAGRGGEGGGGDGGGGGGGAGVKHAPIRRASTGQFSDDPVPQRRKSTDTTFPPLSSHPLPLPAASEPHRKIFYQPPPDTAPRNRPLPPTPLDIAMPLSRALRTRGYVQPVSMETKTRQDPPVTMTTNLPANQTNGLPVATSHTPTTHHNQSPVQGRGGCSIPVTSLSPPTLAYVPPPSIPPPSAVSHHHSVDATPPPSAASHHHSVDVTPPPSAASHHHSVDATPPPSAASHHHSVDATPPHHHSVDATPPPSAASHHHSVDATLQDVTDQMSRALAQFDDLLGVAQTSL